jgi:hypothetical protein
VIVGAFGYSSSTGRAYVYYGGVSMDTTADVTMTGEGTNNFIGRSVAGAGDVNNDGYDDVIVGATFYSSYTGRAYVYYGGVSMDNTADVTMTGEGTNNYFGDSISGTGDVNNDGYDDVIIGAYGHSSFTGRAYVYYGGVSMDTTADVTMDGSASSYFGYSVSIAGDVNGDSYDDVIVSVYTYSSYTGRAYVYYGGSSMDTTADVTMTGEGTNNFFGRPVAGAGDVNNDGYDDVIIGAFGYPDNGKVYIYSDNSATLVDRSLPVELTDFAAVSQSGGVTLTWTTESETENLGFILERNIVGANHDLPSEWSQIASYITADALAGHGSTSEAHEYAYTDAAVVPGATYLYRLGDVDYSGSVTYHKEVEVKVEVESAQTPTVFGLKPAYPNPFNPSLTIPYSLIENGQMSLKVYNLRGELVETLMSAYALKGAYSLDWQPVNLSAGMYLIRMQAGNHTSMQKVVFVK